MDTDNNNIDLQQRMAAITRAVLEAMLATCEEDLRGIRDRAVLLVGFAAGGRRRDELVSLGGALTAN